MTSLCQSATARRIREQCSDGKPARTALHIPTNHSYQVVMAIPGAGVELVDMEGRAKYVTWATWCDGEIWRELP
jgi:hypothetical protein